MAAPPLTPPRNLPGLGQAIAPSGIASQGQVPRQVLINLTTPRFLVRTVRPEDAHEEWVRWTQDLDIVDPLNTRMPGFDVVKLQAYIRSFDQLRKLLTGVYDKDTKKQIGFYMNELNWQHATVGFNVAIGDKAYWGKRAVLETRAALLDFYFEKLGFEKAIGMPLARNFPAVFNYKAQGWRLEGVLMGQCKDVKGGLRLDQYQFGMLREDWRALKAAGKA
jgi:RimJ/RimL family protein N-acetyltransferase